MLVFTAGNTTPASQISAIEPDIGGEENTHLTGGLN